MWYQLNKIWHSDKGEVSAEICVPHTSPWFDGHFPEEPVLPGVAQIGMVYDVLKEASDGDLNILSISRIRFKRIVRPGDPLTIVVSPGKNEAGAYAFRILIHDELVCNGVVRVEKTP